MKRQRRPFVRTLLVGSALAVTGCEQSEIITNPAPPELDTVSTDVTSPEPPPPIAENPAFDEDDVSEPAESDAGN